MRRSQDIVLDELVTRSLMLLVADDREQSAAVGGEQFRQRIRSPFPSGLLRFEFSHREETLPRDLLQRLHRFFYGTARHAELAVENLA